MQIGNSLLLSGMFHNLSSGAQMLFLCMSMESGGRRDFTFPLSSATKYGFPPRSFRRYVEELKQHGFIEKQSMANVRQPNEYRFSFAWKSEKPP